MSFTPSKRGRYLPLISNLVNVFSEDLVLILVIGGGGEGGGGVGSRGGIEWASVVRLAWKSNRQGEMG